MSRKLYPRAPRLGKRKFGPGAPVVRAAAVLLAAALPLAPPPCQAGRIAIQVRPASHLAQDRVATTVTLVNRGDAPARAVRVEAGLLGHDARSGDLGTLDAGESRTARLTLGPAPPRPGAYSIFARTRYRDTAGRNFCVVSAVPLITAEPDADDERITVAVRSARIAEETDLSVCVSNRGPQAVSGRLRICLSDDFAPSDRDIGLLLPPAAATTLVVRVRNLTALPGSRYAAFAAFDDETASRHHSAFGAATLAVVEPPPLASPADRGALAGAALLLAVFLAVQFLSPRAAAAGLARWAGPVERVTPALVLLAITAYLLTQIPPSLLLADTTAVGGDLPAHNYLASHLRDQLFRHGRIISWAGGWWCGFPMFQYYFPLPYLLAALLSALMPFNVAFKIASVLGIFLLPPAAYAAGRLMRLPRPGPALLALAMVPLLFDRSNTMWGVNIYSTFAGMVANSLSFPIMLLFIASAWRDADDGRFRLRTALLLAALLASHFFTSIVAGLVVAIFPLLAPQAGGRRALSVLLREGLLGLGLMAWWIVPLVAKRAFSVDFGENWPVDLPRQLPGFCLPLAPFGAAAAAIGLRRRSRFVAVTCWMLLIALGLFHFGYRWVSPVFVNVRLWPFIVYSLLALAAAGAALLLQHRRAQPLALLAAAIAALAFGPARPNLVRGWAAWNYSGLESRPDWPLFRNLVLPLRGTPGRLANDLHEDNNSFGSSRIFECVPHLIGKPILEGGIVNSALGAMAAYYIQGETSRQCAGYPPIVRPASFDITNATRHLELFNVKHFIARWAGTRAALAQSPDWRLLRPSGDWALFELTRGDGRYVCIPARPPLAVRTAQWKEAGLEWLYTPQALDQPFALLAPDEPAGPDLPGLLSDREYHDALRARAAQAPAAAERGAAAPGIRHEEVTDGRIRFTTDRIGAPHIVKCTWFPNWKVRGADRVYRVTPCFMLVYPTQAEVELYYGATVADNAGRIVTALGVLAAAAAAAGRRRA